MPYLELDKDLKTYYEIYDFTNPWEKSETIFFVHGFTENLTAWNAWIPHLSRKYRLVLFDIRGFGKLAQCALRLVSQSWLNHLYSHARPLMRLVARNGYRTWRSMGFGAGQRKQCLQDLGITLVQSQLNGGRI